MERTGRDRQPKRICERNEEDRKTEKAMGAEGGIRFGKNENQELETPTVRRSEWRRIMERIQVHAEI